MKITVIGCGTIGKLWLSALSQQGHDIQGWLRLPQPNVMVAVNDIRGKLFQQLIPTNNLSHLRESELVIASLKAGQISNALNPLSRVISQECPILLLHNGMGTIDELNLAHHPLLAGITTQGAWQDHQQVYHVANGITHIGALNNKGDQYSYVADILHKSLPDVAWHNQIINTCWQKLAVNCIINPLSVIYDCTNGELLNYDDQIRRLNYEIYSVMDAEGIHTKEELLYQYVISIMSSTTKNYSSMLQDIRNQRQTEIDYITGYLLKRARSYGIPTPENDRIYQQIKYKEENYDSFSAGLSR
nr:2-dehydropantoate 2-reductase [uncultured Moellerella sp.]